MLKRLLPLISLLTLLLLAGACGDFNTGWLPQATASPTVVRNILATYQPSATPPPRPPSSPPPLILTPSLVPAPTMMVMSSPSPVASASAQTTHFCCLRFAPGPYASPSDVFPAGTEIVYAVWDYSSLAPADRIRRIWLRDGLIWLAREEDWDWETYGASGTVRDLSIFDFEGSGLLSAEYTLQLYVNDILQQEGDFVILPP